MHIVPYYGLVTHWFIQDMSIASPSTTSTKFLMDSFKIAEKMDEMCQFLVHCNTSIVDYNSPVVPLGYL